MTLFEKIYFSCLVLNVIFFILRMANAFESLFYIVDLDLEWLGYLLEWQFGLTITYLVVKLILCIWGIDIDLFPCIE